MGLSRFCWAAAVVSILWLPQNASGEGILDEIAEAVHTYHIRRPPREEVVAVPLIGIDDYLQSLDPYSAYLTREEYNQIQRRERDGYDGIGAEMVWEGEDVVLIPFQGGSLDKAGISRRHYVRTIDGQATRGMGLEEVAGLLAGPPGSTVRLGLSRARRGPYREIRVRRQRFTPPSVEWVTEGDIEYLRIRRFVARQTMSSLKTTIWRQKGKGLPVVLDLRDCSGGDLHEALDAVSLFLPGGVPIGSVEAGRGDKQVFRSLPDQQIVFERVLILVGPATASAAEVFVAVLRTYEMTLVVGQRTYGKCTSQTYIELSDGSALRLTNLKIVYPSGEFCAGAGLVPDIGVTDAEMTDTDGLISKGMRRLQEPSGNGMSWVPAAPTMSLRGRNSRPRAADRPENADDVIVRIFKEDKLVLDIIDIQPRWWGSMASCHEIQKLGKAFLGPKKDGKARSLQVEQHRERLRILLHMPYHK